ncbi:MAG: peptidylprolyl isomerase [Nitrospirota bacterium]
MKRVLTLLIALVFVASCSQGGSTGGYVAKVDNVKITKEDVQAEMNALPDMAKQFFMGPEGAARFVDELTKKEMLYIEAKKRGLDKDKEFQRRVEEFKKITLINQLLEKEIESGAKITDADIKNFYDTHKEDFILSSQVKISQIVVKSEDDAKKVYDRLKAGEDFGKIAAEMSTDANTAKAGGNLGTFKKGELSPELEDAVFRLKKGEVSMPLRLKDGLHILKVIDLKGTQVEFEKVKGMIHQRLVAEKQKASFDKFMEGLKKKYKVDINKDAVSKLNISPIPPSGPLPPSHPPVNGPAKPAPPLKK